MASAKKSQQQQLAKAFTEQQIKEQILKALPAHMLAAIPDTVVKRVNALKNVQVKLNCVEAKFYEELHLLECKYQSKYDEIYEKRKQIITGDREPTEEEAKWTLDQDEEEQTTEEAASGEPKQSLADQVLAEDLKSKINLATKDIKGVPDFWLATFKSVEVIGETIQEYDEPILKHLYDLRVRLHDTKPYGYTLEFHFNDNEFFTNKVLTKSYELRMDVDPKDPFAYEGPDEYKTKGCTIDWKKGKNVTVHTEKKKQKHKQSGSIRVVTKEVKQESFFNYFDSPKSPAFIMGGESADNKQVAVVAKKPASTTSGDDLDDEEKMEEALLQADFELGELFKERIIPRGILYFTGELVDDAYGDEYDEDDDDEDDDDEDDEDDDDDDEDEDDGGKHHHGKHHGGKGHVHGAQCAHGHGPAKGTPKPGAATTKQSGKQQQQQSTSGSVPKDQPPECKQN